MQASQQNLQSGLVIPDALLTSVLVAALAGVLVGALQIRAARWHPVRAASPLSWFAYPACAGLFFGLMEALLKVPHRDPSRPIWLVLCVITGCASALLGSGVLAYFWKAPRTSRRLRRSPPLGALGGNGPGNRFEELLRTILRGFSSPKEEEQPGAAKDARPRPVVHRGPPKVIPRRDVVKGAKTLAEKPSQGDAGAKNVAVEIKPAARFIAPRRFLPAGQETKPESQGRFEKPIR